MNEYVPSDKVPKLHVAEVEVAAGTVQVVVTPADDVAVNTTVAPEITPATVKVGVLSLVTLSVVLLPVSESVAKSTLVGAFGFHFA